MTSKCSICRLPAQARAVVDAALRENMPLKVISDQTGLAVTTLWRHGRHLVKAEGAATPPKAARPVKTAVPAPVELAEPAPAVQTPDPEPPIDQEASRKRALGRTEQLWDEVTGLMADAKKPVVIVKPDGSELEVPIGLGTRASIVRAGVGVVDLGAKLAGVYDTPAAPLFGAAVFQSVIVCPKLPGVESPLGPVIDVQPEPAALTDGKTPAREE